MQVWEISTSTSFERLGEPLVQAADPASPVITNTKNVNDINALANASGAVLLPPALSLIGKSGLVITVNKTAAAALITNDNNDLSNPSGDVLDSLALAFIASERLLDINEIRRKVTHKVYIASRRAERHDHVLPFNKSLGLSVQGLEEGAVTLKVVILTRLKGLQVLAWQFTGGIGLFRGNVRIGRRERLGGTRRAALADRMLHFRGVDQNKDSRRVQVNMFWQMG
jgi:hypothetical protein